MSKIRFAEGHFTIVPARAALAQLQRLSDHGAVEGYRTLESLLLGQLMVASDNWVNAFVGESLQFLKHSRRINGLESVFLTALQNAFLTGEQSLYKSGVSALGHILAQASPTNVHKAVSPIIFFDRSHDLATVISRSVWEHISSDLAGTLHETESFGNHLRLSAQEAASYGFIDFVTTVGVFAGAGAGIGAAAGAVVGSPGGPPGIVGGAAGGAALGGAAGAAFGLGVAVAQAVTGGGNTGSSSNAAPSGSSSNSTNSTTTTTTTSTTTTSTSTNSNTNTDPNAAGSQPVDPKTIVTKYPVPDSLLELGTRYVELVSTPNPEGDPEPERGVTPPPAPSPEPTRLAGVATFAIHQLPRISNAGTFERLGMYRDLKMG